jgi:hypothetical protein
MRIGKQSKGGGARRCWLSSAPGRSTLAMCWSPRPDFPKGTEAAAVDQPRSISRARLAAALGCGWARLRLARLLDQLL